MEKKHCIRIFFCIIISVVVLSIGCGYLYWNKNLNKNNLLKKYTVDGSKEVYLLGTIGKKHFNKFNCYSMANMVSVIENVKPDSVLIQARDSHHKRFGIIDGEIDACVAYGYCFEQGIDTDFIDWWVIDNIYPQEATTNLRADNIFIKINRLIHDAPKNSKLLVLIDSKNFYEIIDRFEVSNYKETQIEDLKSYFSGVEKKFEFPVIVTKIWRDRTYYYSYLFVEELRNTKDLDPKIIDKYDKVHHDKFYLDEIKYCKFLNNNILFN